MEQSRICQSASSSFAAQRVRDSSPLDAVCIFDGVKRKREKGAAIIYPILRPVNAKLVGK